MEEKRMLIERYLPVEEISEEAKLEKLGNAKPPMSSIHYWWTRKPLVASRAVVLASLLPSDFDITSFKRLIGLGRSERAHNYNLTSNEIEILKQKYIDVWGKIPTILDPFGGGGAIAFEALRVGVNTLSNDYNPVAYLIQKATLEYPKKYGLKLYIEVEKGLTFIFNETQKEMDKYYPQHDGVNATAYIWCWVVRCPSCGFLSPLVGQWWLARSKNKKIYMDPSIENSDLIIRIKEGSSVSEGTASDGKGVCKSCGFPLSEATIKADISENKREKLLAVILSRRGGKEYVLPTDEDFNAISLAEDAVKRNWSGWLKEDLIPLEEMPDESRGAIWAKLYLKYWIKLLNPRQTLLFVTLLKNTKSYVEALCEKEDNEFAMAVSTYMSFIFGKLIDYNSRPITWHRTNQQISHALATRGIAMSWDHAEVNPFIKGSGSLVGVNKSILGGLKYSLDKIGNTGTISISQKSVTALETKADLIITDPPYLDDIIYAEFSEFFYVWERKVIDKFYKMGDVPKSEDMSVGGWGRTPEFFNKMFRLACKRMYDLLNDDGLFVTFFAHSSPEAWGFVIDSLQKAGFRITATWPIHTESTTNPLASGKASILSSIIIVARKRQTDKSGYIEEIQEEIKDHLKKRLDEFWSYGLRGADLTVSAMGATLDIFTQYSEIKSYTGEMKVKDILELVQKQVANYVLDRYTQKSASLDNQTSFYLYARLSGLDAIAFDTANLISKSLNIDLKSFEKQGLIEFIAGKKVKGIKLLKYNDREHIGLNSLIDAVHLTLVTFAKGGYADVERELSNIPYSKSEIKDILVALLALPPEDPERQISQKILERMGYAFPKEGQSVLEDY